MKFKKRDWIDKDTLKPCRFSIMVEHPQHGWVNWFNATEKCMFYNEFDRDEKLAELKNTKDTSNG